MHATETRYTVRQTNAGEWVVSNNRTGDVKSVHPDERSANRAAATLERKRVANLRRFADLYR